jgi:hypothetical protein
MCEAFVKLARPYGDQSGGARKWGIREGCQDWFRGGGYHPAPKSKKNSGGHSGVVNHRGRSKNKEAIVGRIKASPPGSPHWNGQDLGPSNGQPWDPSKSAHPYAADPPPFLRANMTQSVAVAHAHAHAQQQYASVGGGGGHAQLIQHSPQSQHSAHLHSSQSSYGVHNGYSHPQQYGQNYYVMPSYTASSNAWNGGNNDTGYNQQVPYDAHGTKTWRDQVNGMSNGVGNFSSGPNTSTSDEHPQSSPELQQHQYGGAMQGSGGNYGAFPQGSSPLTDESHHADD